MSDVFRVFRSLSEKRETPVIKSSTLPKAKSPERMLLFDFDMTLLPPLSFSPPFDISPWRYYTDDTGQTY